MMRELIRKILNEETNQGKYISALEDLTEDFKNEDCVCDIKIEYKPEEEIYLINVILGNLDMDDKFNGVNWRERDYRGKLKTKIRKEVFDYLPIPFFVEFKQTPRCKDYKNLQESEDDKEKKIQKNLIVLEKLISMFDYSEVCDMWIDYHYEDDDYIIRSKMSTKNHNTAALEKEFEFLENSIESLGFTNCYVFRPYYVENCEDEIKFLNESEDKKSRFLSTIEEDGLFQVMQDTGLSLPQIYTKTGELPREVFERYIKDFLENDEIGWDLSIQISPNKIVDSFYLSDGVVTIEVNEVDSIGRVVAGSFERLSVLSDEEIFSLVNEMTQINDDYLDYM